MPTTHTPTRPIIIHVHLASLLFIIFEADWCDDGKEMGVYELAAIHPSIFPLSLRTSVRSVFCKHDEEGSSVGLFQDRPPTKSAMNMKQEHLIRKQPFYLNLWMNSYSAARYFISNTIITIPDVIAFITLPHEPQLSERNDWVRTTGVWFLPEAWIFFPHTT